MKRCSTSFLTARNGSSFVTNSYNGPTDAILFPFSKNGTYQSTQRHSKSKLIDQGHRLFKHNNHNRMEQVKLQDRARDRWITLRGTCAPLSIKNLARQKIKPLGQLKINSMAISYLKSFPRTSTKQWMQTSVTRCCGSRFRMKRKWEH